MLESPGALPRPATLKYDVVFLSCAIAPNQAFACFRMASILQGVFKRSLSGQAAAADGAEVCDLKVLRALELTCTRTGDAELASAMHPSPNVGLVELNRLKSSCWS